MIYFERKREGSKRIRFSTRTSDWVEAAAFRDERLRELATRDEPPTERERLLCVHGLGARTLTLLEDGGYKTLASVCREDEDRLGIRTGLGLKKAAAITDTF